MPSPIRLLSSLLVLALLAAVCCGIYATAQRAQSAGAPGDRHSRPVVAREGPAGSARRASRGDWQPAPELVTDDVLRRADNYPGDWMMWARNYGGERFSPLAQIDRGNVASIAPRWAFSLGTHGAQQCTPLVHRGVMYVTTTGGKLFAVKADTGALLWQFASDPPEDAARYGANVNRGAALWGDLVIWCDVAGRVFALDRKTGVVRWQARSEYYRLGYTKNHAPLVVDGKVITGTSGGEWGVRGFLEAWDAKTGKQLWKTHTIPAPGEPGHETWKGGSEAWKHGGASTWVTGSYDPALKLLYWATGNGAPWSAEQRPGDNLYTCSVLALDPATGKIRWHFQFVPNDDWDYDATVTPVLADVEIGGRRTPVLAMAIKNGFLYLLDRRAGKFLRASRFAEKITWAKGLDAGGRPIETPTARPPAGSADRVFVAPSTLGAANWWGMALDPSRSRLVLVANETGMEHIWDPVPYTPGEAYTGMDYAALPKVLRRTAEKPGRVCAWDLRTMRKVWEADREPDIRWGGPLVTGGDLVFSGTLQGYLQAMDAETGRRLWQFQTGSGIMAHPMSYAVDGRQYVAVLSGMGGAVNAASLSQDLFKNAKNHNSSGMVFAFAVP